MKIKYYKIVFEGIDKSGKDTICAYIDLLSNRKFDIKSRGVLSLIAYAKMYNRDFEYDLSEHERINVFIDVDKEDWEVRCALTNEKKISYEESYEAFEYAIKKLTQDPKNILLRYNSSTQTPIQIAKNVLSIIEELENKK